MRPPRNNYEKVPEGIPVIGIIEKVLYDEKHVFKAFKKGDPDTTNSAVRFQFKLDGCSYPHHSRWMKFNVGEKANLYKKYLSALVEDAVPDMDIDLDILNGLKIKTTWSSNGDFQNLDSIEALSAKVKQTDPLPTIDLNQDNEPPVGDEECPF